jgi:hypothetical protein
MLVLTVANLTGVRPADYDSELIEQAVSLRDGSLFDRYAHFSPTPVPRISESGPKRKLTWTMRSPGRTNSPLTCAT